MNPNSSENLNDQVDKKESDTELRNLFLRKFNSEVSAMTDPAKKNQIIEDICTKDANTPEITSKKQEVLANNRDELGEFDLEKVSIFDLRKGLTKDFFRLENMKKSYLGEVISNYDISEKDAEKIKKELKNKSFSYIKNLTEKTVENDKFLQKTLGGFFGGKKPKSKNISDTFGVDYSKRLSKIKDQNKREEVEHTLALLQNGTFRASDIEFLYTSGFLNATEKLELFRKYYKTISLSEAKKHGLISESDATKKKKEIIKKVIKDKETELKFSDGNLEHIGKDLQDDEVFLTVDDLGVDEKIIDKYVDTVGLQKMEDEFYDVQKEGEAERVESGPKNSRDFKSILDTKYSRQILGLSNFVSDNYVEITKTEKDKEIKTVYQIISTDNGQNGFTLKAVGVGDDIDLNSASDSENFLYVNFLSLLEKSGNDFQLSVNFVDKKELKKQIEDPKNPRFKENSFNSYDEESLENGDIENYHIEKLEKEIVEIKEKLKEKQNDDFLKDLLKRKEDKLKRLNSKSGKNLLQELNLEKLIDQLDEIDGEGKSLGLHAGTYLEWKDGSFQIEGIDLESQEIIVNGQKVGFATFYQTFKKEKLKRVRKYNDFCEFLDAFKKEGKDIPDNYVFESGKFIAKDVENGDDKGNEPVEFFIGKDNEVVKIESISGDKVTIRLGEKEDGKEDKKGKKKFKYTLSMQKNTETLSLNDFKKGILSREMIPDWKLGRNDIKEKSEEALNNKFSKSFGSRFMGRLSVADLVAGGKLWLDNIQEHLKKGSDVLAAEKALKWGKFLPEEVKNSLLIKVESSKRKSMDEALESLGNIGSNQAAEMVEKWILNLDSPQYKKEAATLWMIKKYGQLATKHLSKYKGQFIFYQALGGKIGDTLYKEEKQRCESPESKDTFNEEILVQSLLGKQCGDGGYNGIKRHSKLNKDYEGKWAGGIKDELDDGYKLANSMVSVKSMISEAHSQISKGTIPNGLGVLKKIPEKGGSLKEVNEVFFTLLFSGALYDTDGKIFGALDEIFKSKQPIIFAKLGADRNDMKLANNAILSISKKIGQAEPKKYPDIFEEAQKIYNNVHQKKKNYKELYQDTIDFYKKYGDVIVRSLYMVDDDESEFEKTDKLLEFGKDNDPVLKNYYDKLKESTNDGVFGDDAMDDWGIGGGITGTNKQRNVLMHLALDTKKSFAKTTLAPHVWKLLKKDLYSSKNKLFDSSLKVDSPKNIKLQKEYIIKSLREIFTGFRMNHTGELLALYNSLPGTGSSFREWGIDILRDFGDIDSDDILNGTSAKSEAIFDRVSNQILNSSGASVGEDTENSNFLSGEKALDNISNITENIKSANDDIFQEK